MTQASNKSPRRRKDAMEFAYAGPFSSLIDSRVGRSFVKPVRDLSGKPLDRQPRYSCSSQNYTIERALLQNLRDTVTLTALVDTFGRELNSALEEVSE